jgi:hypothetical protein
MRVFTVSERGVFTVFIHDNERPLLYMQKAVSNTGRAWGFEKVVRVRPVSKKARHKARGCIGGWNDLFMLLGTVADQLDRKGKSQGKRNCLPQVAVIFNGYDHHDKAKKACHYC